jgi:hypothetical protein
MCAGNVAATAGSPQQAVRLLAGAASMREALAEDLRPAVVEIQDHIINELRQRLGAAQFDAAWEEGRTRLADESIAAAHEALASAGDTRT